MGSSQIEFVIDLEGCLYYAAAGGNLRAVLFDKVADGNIAVTREVLSQVREFDKDLADEIKTSGIQIVDLSTDALTAAGALTEVLLAQGYKLDLAASDKIPIIAVAHCAANGTNGTCTVVTGDDGIHKSSMKSLCSALNKPVIAVADF